MNYPELLRKRDLYQSGRASIPELTLQSYEQAFEIEYAHNSTAIEGNTLTLMETKVLDVYKRQKHGRAEKKTCICRTDSKCNTGREGRCL